MRNTFFISLLIIAVTIINSCRKDFSTVPSFGNLEFSKDTVFLDTIFTNIGSATYNLKVYNKSNKAITIPEIKLGNGNTSNYRLNVDGISGKEFQDIDILANDSIFVFVETTIDFSSISDPLYTDQILFDNGTNEQNVDLITLVQDAAFIFSDKDPISMKIDSLTLDGKPTTIKGRFLTDAELTFTDEKPYVIYGYAAVPANKTLTINAGAKLYFHNNSGLIVDKDASLKVNGSLDKKVVFEGDRLESSFSNIPGQWGTVWLRKGSKDNELNHTVIKNASIGILVDSTSTINNPTLYIKNTEIYNSGNYGVLARQANILGENVVIGNSRQISLAATVGGTYNFTHCTFTNFWTNSFRDLPAVLVNNHFTNKNNIIETRDLLAANFTNCIIEGSNNIEFFLDKEVGSLFNYTIENCMIRFDDFNNSFNNVPELDFQDTTHYQNIILNGNADFKDVDKNNFSIGNKSDAINKAKPTAVVNDILGIDRTTAPDIGAYQHINF